MNQNRDQFDHISEEIQKAVRNARESMNFDQLNQTVRRSVNEAMREVRKSADTVRRSVKNEFRSEEGWQPFPDGKAQKTKPDEREQEAFRRQQFRPMNGQCNAAPEMQTLLSPSLVTRRPPGKVSGVLFTVFGSIMFGIFSLFSLIFGSLWGTSVLTQVEGAATLGVFLPLALIGAVMLFRGLSLRKRLNRFRKYVTALDDRKFADIKQIAESIGKSRNYVVKDLKRMMALNMFPDARLSADGQYFLLDQETYQQYEALMLRQKEQQQAVEKQQEDMKDPERRELHEAVAEGKSYIRQIREANDAIPGELISRKLDRLEAITGKIFTYVERKPEQLPELRRFMEYYLPTTMKLVRTYQEFDAQPVQGENITKAKVEIEKTMDTINDAFEKLFDSLFADIAMDVSADISVLQALLAQEGLTKDDFAEVK